MQIDDKSSVMDNPQIQPVVNQLTEAGVKPDHINSVIDEAISKIPGNPTIMVVVRIVKDELINLLKKYEAKHEPKTWLGKMIKIIFG